MHTLRNLHRVTGASVVAITAIALMAGCGDDSAPPNGQQPNTDTTSGAAATEHNQADITFAQGMIPHHQQAIQMAELAEIHAINPDVKDLAAKIETAQGPEIEEMTNWLTDWGAALPSPSMPGHDMGGMMTDEDMKALGAASGAAFDRMFLQMMIKHHEGAVQMAATEQQQGQNPGAKALAEKIEADQTAEIQQMQSLLGAA